MVGTTIENYDFLAFGTAAATYFGAAFFPGSDPLAATLSSFAALAAGFLTRPIGGIVAGHLGDRIGRKFVMIGALLLMGCATFAIGLLPTYAQIGAWAPALLVILRMLQGIGHGAEWGGAVLIAVETASPGRRGLYGAIPQAGVPAGLLLANGAFLISAALPGEWGWRLPFLLSGVLVIIGLILRLRVEETPVFQELKNKREIVKKPILAALRSQPGMILRIVGIRLAAGSAFYLVTTFVLSLLAGQGGGLKSVGLLAVVISSVIGLFSLPFFGFVSDIWGRRRTYVTGAIITVVIAYPAFLMITSGQPILIVLGVVGTLLLTHNLMFAVEGAWFTEMFDPRFRTSGISLGYQGSSIIQGFVPLIAAALYGAFGWVGPASLLALVGIITTVSVVLSPETLDLKSGGIRTSHIDREAK
jgi:MFS family permease